MENLHRNMRIVDPGAQTFPMPSDMWRRAMPLQVREATFVMVGVTFRGEVVRAAVPRNLRPCREYRGGFMVMVAEEGFGSVPLTSAYVWFDLEGGEPAASPPRFIHRRVGSWPGGQTDAKGDGAGHVGIEFGAHEITARFSAPEWAGVRLAVRPDRARAPCAGVDHCIADGGPERDAAWVSIVPWAAEWSDAAPLQIDIRDDAWSDVTPVRLNWAAVGRRAALTLGLEVALAQGQSVN